VAATFAVVVLHVAARGVVDASYGSASWWIANLYRASTCWCVPAFIMISGALLLNPQRFQPAAVFYRKRMGRILIPLAFWTVFYLGLRASFEGLSWPEAARDVVRAGPYGHLWFLYMIAGLYFVTPVLQPFVRSTTRRDQRQSFLPVDDN
jgi:surface polysaccharide O-acyltransferase-like enzyme